MPTIQFTVGGLTLPGYGHITLGPRHPTQAGMITINAQVGDGEIIESADVLSGYGHRAAEKLFEVRDYRAMIMLADRHDWMAAFSGELSITLAMESAMRLTPTPRATVLRTLLAELARIHSHLGFLSYLADGAVETQLWGAVERIRQAFLEWTGNRVHPMLNRVGGLASDCPDGWLAALDDVLDDVAKTAADLRGVLTSTDRFRGLAVLSETDCLGFGLSGPVSRAAGLDLDRRHSGYLAYGQLHRPVQTRTAGDAEARFGVLIDELGTSVDMIRMARAVAEQTPGDVSVRLSRRLKVPEGEHDISIEAPWGIASCFLVSRGGPTPWRVGLRTPSFSNLSALGTALKGARVDQIADVVASLGYTIGDADK
ncbi:MAG TPA: NADH-quinone oxidoreductase subunit D [Tessaracoccus flavescens]|uniref:NADH-quinone oxidoreductase subunit D n=1 Tax=Tessaracoccus flavescens TaxID=399497 RepID=A0A921JSA5_9ACTN|nr:NADH-quinone oxidoreductase subunit D [Tessaracoccus flavescens]